MKRLTTVAVTLAVSLVACTGQAPEPEPTAAGTQQLLPADRESKVALGLAYPSAADLYAALKARAGGGEPLSVDDMPDWTGFWQRVRTPFFDPEQPDGVLTTAKLTPAAMAELSQRRELSSQHVEYDPISDCSPPGFPRWLVIPFLREFIVTPQQTYLFSETVNNLRRIYTDGREHPPADDAYPLFYGDSIGFWSGHTLVIHTSQVRAGIFHRNDPQHSDQLEAVEAWHKADPETVIADVWVYDPVTLTEPWYTQQIYKQVPNPDGYLRIDYWNCRENPNNTIVKTEEGTSQFSDFTFTDGDSR